MLSNLEDKHRIYSIETYIDELTGALNRRYLNLIVDREIQRCRRYKKKFCIMIADLDNFKIINDTYGHLTGDKALRFFTKTTRDFLRAADSIIRYGGDEFIVMLPNTDIAGAERVGNRIIELLKKNEFEGLKLSASIGLAMFPEHGETWEEIFSVADRALYNAKRLGKGRVSRPDSSVYTLVLPTKYIVGRREESSWISSNIKEPGILHVVKGEVGVGKTRLVVETLKKLHVTYAYAKTMGALHNVSYFLIRDLLKNLLDTRRYDVFSTFETLKESQRMEISKFMPYIFKSHIQKSAKGDKFTLYEALISFLKHIAHERLLLVFDDLQWIDRASADFVNFLVGSQPENITFLGIFRMEELSNSPIYDVISLLSRTRQYNELFLEPLSKVESTSMVQLALGAPPSQKLANLIFEETGGNPFFIEEILRKFHDGNLISFENGQWELKGKYVPSPSQSIEQIVQRKIQEFSNQERTILDYASVCGREVDAIILSKASGYNEGEVYDILDKMVQRNILKEGTSSDYLFSEGVIREIIENKLSKGKMKFYHKTIAKAIEEIHSEDIKDYLEELVHHYQIAGVPDKTKYYAKMAGDRAHEVYTFERAIVYYKIAIGKLPPSDEAFEIMSKLIDSYKSLGKHREAIEQLKAMFEEYPHKKKELNDAIADAYIRLGEWNNAIEHYKKAIELTTDERERYRIELELAWALLNYPRHDEAGKILEKAQNYFETHGKEEDNYNMFVWIHTGFATIANMLQKFSEAVKHYKLSLKYSEKMQSLYNMAVSHLNLGIALSQLEKPNEALEHYKVALEMSHKGNYIYLYSITLQNIGQIHNQLGHFKKALGYLTECERNFELMKNYFNLMLNHLSISDVYINLDELDKAMHHAQKAYELSLTLKTPFDHIYAKLAMSQIQILNNEYQKAKENLESVKDSIYSTPDPTLPIRWHEIMGDIYGYAKS